jgi:hypothetical protein
LTASVTSASYALTASYLFGSSVGSSSYSETASYALTASYFLTSSVTSASLAQTASYAILADTASLAITSSHAITSSYAIVFNVSGGFTASGLIYPTSDGPEKSFLQTDGLGNLTFEYVETIYEYIRNGETYQLDKGTPLYISGAQGANSIAYAADAGNPAKMPVIYIAGERIDPGALGKGIALGRIDAVNTTGYPPGTDIYVAVGGGWTSVRPTGSAIIQLLGLVTKEGNASANGGKGVVLNPGPATLPNLNSGSIWVGDSNSYPVAIPTSSIIPEIVPSASFSATASYVLLQDIALSTGYMNDAAAAAAGVPLGGVYRSGNFLQIRIS